MALTRDEVETHVSIVFDRMFQDLDMIAQDKGVKPSELAKMLDQSSWGLGNDYREWFENGDEEFV